MKNGDLMVIARRALIGSVCALSLCGAVPVHAAEPAAQFRDCADCPEMVRIPSGTFVMGTPAHESRSTGLSAESQAVIVKIHKPFAIGRVEVTRREYRAFIQDAGYDVRSPCLIWDDEKKRFAADRSHDWESPGRPREPLDDHPAACVSWSDAKAYVQWLAHKTGKSYRLPSEAEWEYVARAGSNTRWPWGDNPADACDFANIYDLVSHESYAFGWEAVHCRDGYADLAPVGALRANAFGVYDMIGNVWEWTEDCWTDSYVGRPRDARAWVWTGGCTQHIRRGGSWTSPAEQARSAYREVGDVAERRGDGGFRIALDLDTRPEGR